MDFKKILPHLIASVVLLLVSMVFYAPNAFEGKVLTQPDNDKARAMQTEMRQYLAKGEPMPLWTNSAFSGMPTYQILSKVDGNFTQPLYRTAFLWNPLTSVWAQTFAAMLCMYLLLSVLRLDWRVSLFGALAYGICTYNVDILEAGHSTKMAALAFVPGIFAGAVLAGRGKYLLGAGVLGLFLAMQGLANHLQITYYSLLFTGVYFICLFVESILNKTLARFGKAALACAVAGALGFAANTSRMWPTYEYSKETIRGESQLSAVAQANGNGLSKEYLFGWSYGIWESLTLVVPRAAGGGANERITTTKLFESTGRGATAAQKQQLAQQLAPYYYSGSQPFVGTAIYLGVIVCFLFILGAFLARGSEKWWLLSGGILTIMLAWGDHFALNLFLYDHFPMFNKFRAVTMVLGMTQVLFAILGAIGLQKFFDADISVEKKKQALYYAAGIVAVLCLLGGFFSSTTGPNDAAIAAQDPSFPAILKSDRAALARGDAFRSLGFLAVAAALLWFALHGRVKSGIAVLAIAAASLFDQWGVSVRNIHSDKYVTEKAGLAPEPAEPYDQQIKQDKDLHYRVLDLNRGAPAGNWNTSYHHKSMGGYHAAKLRRYQEVIDTFLTSNLGENLHIVGMLNGKYLVTQDKKVIPNPLACGNAWFVKHYSVVPNADAEMQALHRLNPRDSAVLQPNEAAGLQGFVIQPDTAASIKLSAYHPDKMEYTYSAATDQFAVFSEVYYPPSKGWKTYLNGQPAPDFFKVDYLLRGMKLPAGKDMKLEMRFEPRSYYLGEKISMAASALVLLLFFAGLFFQYKNGSYSNPDNLTDIPPATDKPDRSGGATKPTVSSSTVNKGKK
jgi:hypothetical protein